MKKIILLTLLLNILGCQQSDQKIEKNDRYVSQPLNTECESFLKNNNIFTVFSILIILTTIFFIAIGTVRDSRYYILILVYIIVYKIILSFTNRSKKK